jgi:hypothetical protein
VDNDRLDIIARRGWMVQGVFGTEESPKVAGFAEAFSYTVGLTKADRPELYLDMLGPQQATPILNRIAEKVDGGWDPTHGELVDAEYSVKFRMHGPIDPDKAQMNTALRYFPDDVTAWQVLFPDTAGKYPGDDGYDMALPQRLMELA